MSCTGTPVLTGLFSGTQLLFPVQSMRAYDSGICLGL
jgi:hypothetical protein